MVIDTGVFIEHIRAKDKLKTALYLIPDNIYLDQNPTTLK